MSRQAVYLVLALFACGGGAYSQESTATLAREARVAAHRQSIEDIMKVHKLVQLHGEGSDAFRTLPRVSIPAIFDSTIEPALREIEASPEQIGRLREVNTSLWALRNETETSSPEVATKVKNLIDEHAAALRLEQHDAAYNAYMARQEDRRQKRIPRGGVTTTTAVE